MGIYRNGVDVSHFQGDISWNSVLEDPKKISFCLIKASDGVDCNEKPNCIDIDPKFTENWDGFASIKKTIPSAFSGAYHLFRANHEATPQFQLYKKALLSVVNNCDNNRDCLAISIADLYGQDIKTMHQRLQTFIELLISDDIYGKFNCNLYIHSNQNFLKENLSESMLDPELNMLLKKCKLWVARWSQQNPDISGTPWRAWDIWQYTDKGKVDGIDGDVFLNYLANN